MNRGQRATLLFSAQFCCHHNVVKTWINERPVDWPDYTHTLLTKPNIGSNMAPSKLRSATDHSLDWRTVEPDITVFDFMPHRTSEFSTASTLARGVRMAGGWGTGSRNGTFFATLRLGNDTFLSPAHGRHAISGWAQRLRTHALFTIRFSEKYNIQFYLECTQASRLYPP